MVFYRQDKTVSKTLDIQFRKYRLHFVTMICKNLFFCVLKNDVNKTLFFMGSYHNIVLQTCMYFFWNAL